jgi:hypothetical protein
MQPSGSDSRKAGLSFRTLVLLAVALVVLLVVVIGRPGYALFFTIGVAIVCVIAIGLVVAGILYLWHRFKPLKDDDVENKRPLGLE